jgi:hypothetical protein
MVRRVVPRVLRRFPKDRQSEALTILAAIEWQGDMDVGTAVLDVLHPKYALDPNALPLEAVDTLLARVETISSLEGRDHDILEFIAFASTVRPGQTVEMLLRRIRAGDPREERGERSWIPIPYNGHGLTLPGLAASPDYKAILRSIRDAAAGAAAYDFWLPELYHVAASEMNTGLAVLSEWVVTNEQEKIEAVSHLLRAFDHELVFSSHAFVADLLDAAAGRGDACLTAVRGELFGLAVGGITTGSPDQPPPRYLRARAEATKLASAYASRPAVQAFYQDLMEHAEQDIKGHMEDWESEGEDD